MQRILSEVWLTVLASSAALSLIGCDPGNEAINEDAERDGDIGELYDLKRDPEQLENLIDSERHESIRSRLEARLTQLRDCSGVECH